MMVMCGMMVVCGLWKDDCVCGLWKDGCVGIAEGWLHVDCGKTVVCISGRTTLMQLNEVDMSM